MSRCIRCRGTGTVKRKVFDPTKSKVNGEEPYKYQLVTCTACKGTKYMKTQTVRT